ncbi:hypothetical protein LTR99_003460 [Exophiala xenobiotica]|uniref:Major facilitator superfamily (MFS) profile domain-containing protein n=1 Tax=Vermiconidia calcicola TaxID=1690605 RepID=A0AAV9PWV9_9PEZI|nr:hypothetical protein LTR92_009277 [Exophiala xenobiotica]KAK5529168.1 hypothetical protein LTR25_009905 [Vermiconidia calcicola]KAK5547133.1 hypothetical protein LTR23_002772 [Chaetothyriales sp. CCFEE 6169]KAK5266385.1 hypothetical protein LTR96_008232 [Exophiala xenobiotica]KAK5305915.1 hypothetical protein LTR99_003460 [Exophiala xenobiotica]
MPKGDMNNVSDAVDAHNEDTSGAIRQDKFEPEQRPRQDSEQVFTPPNGGLQAWLLVLALFLIFANTWGNTSTFGAFQAFYLHNLLSSQSASAISWIGSVQAFLVVFVGVFAGPLFDMGWLRPMAFVGSFLTVFGMFMTSLAHTYYQVFLAQGVCVGFGSGLTYVPALAIVSKYFTTKRPIAIGVGAVGSSVGGVVFPIMFRQLQPQIGFGWTVRSLAFINLAFAVVACIILGRHPGQTRKARSLIDISAFRSPVFVQWTLALFLVYLAYYVPLFFIVSYARYGLGSSENFAFYMLSILNGSSTLGRIVPYILGRKVKPIYTLIFSCLLGAILIFAWIAIESRAAFVVWCVMWGFVAGVLVTAPTSIVAHPLLSPSLDVVGTRLGMSWSAASIGTVIGPPIAGVLVDVASGNFVHGQVFGGVVMAAGTACLIWPLIAIERYDRSKR